jgi:hypothetical protein
LNYNVNNIPIFPAKRHFQEKIYTDNNSSATVRRSMT